MTREIHTGNPPQYLSSWSQSQLDAKSGYFFLKGFLKMNPNIMGWRSGGGGRGGGVII